jgi:hypothetical protein
VRGGADGDAAGAARPPGAAGGPGRNQDDTDQFIGVIAGTVPVGEFFTPENIQRITGAASTTA